MGNFFAKKSKGRNKASDDKNDKKDDVGVERIVEFEIRQDEGDRHDNRANFATDNKRAHIEKETKRANIEKESKRANIEKESKQENIEKDIQDGEKIREGPEAEREQNNKEPSTGKAAQVEPHYFGDHYCSWKEKHFARYQIKCGNFRKCILFLTCARSGDLRASDMFRSYADLFAEIRRQFVSHPFTIHPFSRLRLGIEIFVILSYHLCLFLITLYTNEVHFNPYFHYTIVTTECLYIIFIISNFFTGYVDGVTDRHVVLDLKKIACRYLTTWFVVDALYPWGLFVFYFNLAGHHSLQVDIVIFSTKVLRLPAIVSFINNVMNRIRASERVRTTFHIIVVIYNYLLWNIFFQFCVEHFIENTLTPVYPRPCSWLSVANMWNETIITRRVYAFNRAVGMLRRHSNMAMVTEGACVETFYIVFWTLGWFVCMHCGAMYMILMIGEESAKAKFVTMAQQVKTYMDQRRYPDRIKRKVLKFYVARFHSIYCSEKKILNCLSGQLRDDIIMSISRQLVSEVEFLKQLPRNLLLSIGTKLSIVVFLAGDIIFKINTVADCLYFIDKGTVAIYSESGMEMCHLQDGDYFGEIALVLPPRFRVATVVAITNCELFRLDKKDFEATIARFPTVYEDMKKVALSRREHLKVIDEHHKAEWNPTPENTQSYY